MDYLDSKILSKINKEVKLISSNIGNSNVLIHSDIKNLFLFEFNSRTDLLEKHLLNINEIFSEFNIWMPTFNYDFTSSNSINSIKFSKNTFMTKRLLSKVLFTVFLIICCNIFPICDLYLVL